MNPVTDEQLALFVVNSHMRSHPSYTATGDEGSKLVNSSDIVPIDHDLLRKYILYAKTFVKPRLQEVDKERVRTVTSHFLCDITVCTGVGLVCRSPQAKC